MCRPTLLINGIKSVSRCQNCFLIQLILIVLHNWQLRWLWKLALEAFPKAWTKLGQNTLLCRYWECQHIDRIKHPQLRVHRHSHMEVERYVWWKFVRRTKDAILNITQFAVCCVLWLKFAVSLLKADLHNMTCSICYAVLVDPGVCDRLYTVGFQISPSANAWAKILHQHSFLYVRQPRMPQSHTRIVLRTYPSIG